MLNSTIERSNVKSRLHRFFRDFPGKSIVLLYSLLLVAGSVAGQAPDSWTKQADFGGTERAYAVGFSIDGKGYIGTGFDFSGSYKNDFWEYDPATDTWMQKADFAGKARAYGVGFSIGSKGYIGTGFGIDNSYKKDFWEYDPAINTWTQKAKFGGTARFLAVGFSIGSKGYIGTGDARSNYENDFWEYDPETDTWTEKASFGGTERQYAVGFSIGNKGYIGTGDDGNSYKNDFWEYDPFTNTWTEKANFGGTERYLAVGFSIGSKGYIGTGDDGITYKNDLWEYDPSTDTWVQKANFGGTARSGAVGFSIGSNGYIGTGFDGNFPPYKRDFWEYTPDEAVTTCNIPTVLMTGNITSTTASLQWDDVSEALGYKVRYKIAGTAEWTTIRSANNDKILTGLAANSEYAWQVKSICGVLPIVSSEWSEKQFFTTDELRLGVTEETKVEVYPNPVSQSATVSFSLNEGSPVLMEILDVNGRSLRVVAQKDFPEGSHEVIFNRESLAAGIYFLQMKISDGVMMKKLMLE